MRLLLRTGLFPLIAMSVEADATDWAHVGRSESGSVIYVDVDSIERDGPVVTYWTRTDSSHDKTDKAMESKTLSKIHCKNRLRTELYVVEYYRNGTSHSGDISGEWHPIVPGSVSDGKWRYLCKAG